MNADIPLAASTPFSEFIRHASPEEKERVYLVVIERACVRQREVIHRAAQLDEGSRDPEDIDT
jgi:hypothetical protein